MRVFHPYGSRARLIEITQKVNGVVLTEAILSDDKKKEIINKFITYVADKLKFSDDIPNVTLSYDDKEAETMKSFGKCTPELRDIRVVVVNRNLADVLRTLGHELVHYKQFLLGKLTPESNTTGSPEENEANTVAGILLRNFGKNNPIIFE